MNEQNELQQFFKGHQEACILHIDSIKAACETRRYRKEDEHYYRMAKVIIDRAKELESVIEEIVINGPYDITLEGLWNVHEANEDE